MDLQQLKTFTAIAKHGSFTKAAEALDYAQSSVSGQIGSLENELGVKLFERIGRKVTLTEEGKKLQSYAEQLLKLADETIESLSNSNEPRGTLTIGAPESVCIFQLPALLKEYRKQYPKVKLILKVGTCQDIYNWLLKNVIDIAFLLDTPISSANLVIHSLSQEPMAVIAQANHPLTQKGFCLPKDLANEDLLLIEEGGCCYRTIFERQLYEAGVQPPSIQEFGSVEMIKNCVMSGLGISILPKMAVQKEIESNQLADLHWKDGDFNIHTQLLYHQEKWLSPALAALIQLASTLFTEDT